ncbi:MAG TPA: sugar phosphate isomerase/epimerase [Anaerolineales bacterium]|nr:sugar phosphate isomerase/epimerase [Anaerolineales bacterium]
MQIGVFTAIWGNLSFEGALDNAVGLGVTAVEIGAGGYPGSQHCPVEELLASEGKRAEWLEELIRRGLVLSALSVHNNPLHPNPETAALADRTIRDAIRLAALLGVGRVNGFSGLPGGAPGERMPNWVTCPWPGEFLEVIDYQWNQAAVPYWRAIHPLLEEYDVKFAIEMHPGFLIYNVGTLLRLREAVGPRLGCNFDPSHLWWNGVDPAAAIQKLGDAIFHVHGKDVSLDPVNLRVNGCNDYTPYSDVAARSWTFRTIGDGHDIRTWVELISVLQAVGYDYVISIEHEDPRIPAGEGLRKAVSSLKEALAR